MSKHDDPMIEINEEHKRIKARNAYIERWSYLFAAGIIIMCVLILLGGCAEANTWCGDKPPVYGTDC